MILDDYDSLSSVKKEKKFGKGQKHGKTDIVAKKQHDALSEINVRQRFQR